MRLPVFAAVSTCALALLTACGSTGGGGDPSGDDGAVIEPDDAGSELDSAVDGGGFDAVHGDTAPSPDAAPVPADTSGVDTAPPKTTAAVSLIIIPDDGKTVITDAIKAATKSVHVEVYLLTDNMVIDALIASKKAGREVSVLLEKSPYAMTTANQPAHDTLQAAGVKVSWTSSLYPLTHSKLMIVDGARAFILTLNFTSSGIAFNREYGLVDTDPGDVAEAEAIFAADVAAVVKPTLSGNLVVSPINSRNALTSLIDGAKSTLDLEMEEVYDATIVTHLQTAAGRGVVVRVIAPGTPDASTATALGTLKAKGVQVRTLASPDVHAKIIVADGARLYVGSINLTKQSLDYNREVGAITDNASAVTRAVGRIATDFTKATPY